MRIIRGFLMTIGAVVVAFALYAGISIALNWDEFKCGLDAGQVNSQEMLNACYDKYGE